MALVSNLRFEFADKLLWQERTKRTLTHTLGEVVKKYNDAKQLNDFGKDLSSSTAIDYVHQSNTGESVGTQDFGDTSALVEAVLGEKRVLGDDKRDRETINTYQALRHVGKLREEMERSGFLTVQLVCDIHEIVLKDLHSKAGKIRDCHVYTKLEDGGIHLYPRPSIIEARFYCIIDEHNIHMEALSGGEDKFQNAQERVKYVFKCAAWLLFNLVSLHPFPDGNGRTCRLLASYVLSSFVTPFPVSVCHSHEQSSRTDYISAIVRCRENSKEGPTELASLLLEGAYLGWERYGSEE